MSNSITRILAVVFLGLVLPFSFSRAEQPNVTQLDAADPTNILFVGNSYLYFSNSLHVHVRRMVVAAEVADRADLNYKSATISGAWLDHHAIESYLEPGRLDLDDPFDVVVLQDSSAATINENNLQRFEDAVLEFHKKIEATGAETALYLTTAYAKHHKKYDPEMLNKIESGYISAANKIDALVIPVGIAFANAHKKRPDLSLQIADGSHPDILGTYLAACVTYGALYNRPSLGNTYDYFGKIDINTATFLQAVADQTLNDFLER